MTEKSESRHLPDKRRTTTKRIKTTRGNKKKSGRKKANPPNWKYESLLIAFECLSFLLIGGTGTVVLIGYIANRYAGTNFLGSLLPFAAGILLYILAVAILLFGWIRLRQWLKKKSLFIPALTINIILLIICFTVPSRYLWRGYYYYRTLLGGKEEAGRQSISHQVYAAYRRLDSRQLVKLVGRAGPYAEDIEAAALAYHLDVDLLNGLAATESSFIPRKSDDGGQGLFQVTKVADEVLANVNHVFPVEQRIHENHRYNAFLGAATLKYYLNQMKGDLFLGLLAYNIGPANGGLRFIMHQYGATDFTTIQPYLQQLPRDYPIRVLAYSLAFRIVRKEGRFLAYEESNNATHIQSLGIPGL
jgi:hypothetical protein